ncbi:MAG TPA: thioesterase family protein [Dermatophilaceae bacterium]|nr:thioesterase family protein [Dermatophilaceae bacterium]
MTPPPPDGAPDGPRPDLRYRVSDLLEVLDLTPDGDDCFRGESQLQRYERIFGGQLMAQGIIAADRTVAADPARADRPIHSLHVSFLASGDDRRPVQYAVERVSDSRSFSSRRVVASQEGRTLATMMMSFAEAATGMEHQDAMPAVPAPDDVADVAAALADVPEPYALVTIVEGPIELRHVEGHLYAGPCVESVAAQSVWLRSRRRPLPDDPIVHAAFLAYAADYSILESALRAHAVSWADPRLRQASLDHAMWFHRPGRADEWVLHVGRSPSASGGRGLGLGSMYAADGRLLATVAQEGMLRLKE